MSAKNVLTQFHIIDNEEKAYWLGFLYADGYINTKEDKIELALAEQDKSHIEKFKNFMGLSNKICYRESVKAYRFSFRSAVCKQDLIDKGCFPKKSLILKFPNENQVPKDLQRYFIRGYFDGDGWFTNTDSCLQVGIIGTEDFINGFLDSVKGIIKVDNKIFEVHRKDGAKRYIFSAYKDVYNFLNYIYSNASVYLNRKYKSYLNFINNGSCYLKN